MFDLYHIKYTLDCLNEKSIAKNYNIQELRHRVRILLIDDENFILEEPLKRQGFNITYKKDIDVLTDVEPYQIVLCDIRGVGKTFKSNKEGAYLIKEMKKIYPTIQVIAYTGSSYDPSYNDYLKCADDVVEKGNSIEYWVSCLDEQIKTSVDPRMQWDRIRSYLLEEGIKTIVVAKLESRYVEGILTRNQKTLEELTNGVADQRAKILSNILTSNLIKLLIEGVINGFIS